MASNSTYAGLIAALSPLVWYRFDQTTGTTIPNSGSATGLTLTLNSTYTLANRTLITGDSTPFIYFNGGYGKTSGYGSLSTPWNYSHTVCFIVEFVSTPAADPFVFTIASTGESTATYYQTSVAFNRASNMSPYQYYESGSSGTDVFTYNGIQLSLQSSNPKFHIAMVKDTTDLSITWYVNGLATRTTYSTEPTGGTSNSLYVNTADDLRTHSCTLGHLFVTNTALSSGTIRSLAYNAGYMPSILAFSASVINIPLDSSIIPQCGNLTVLQDTLRSIADKALGVAIDGSIDQSVINPSNAYQQVYT